MICNNLVFKVEERHNSVYKCIAYYGDNDVCECQLSVDKDNIWTISSWYTNKNYKHQGIGKLTMNFLLTYVYEIYSHPTKIQYIWNGANSYVMDWLNKNFDAECQCSIAVQKISDSDDWSSHIYDLNVDKMFSYFNINKNN